MVLQRWDPYRELRQMDETMNRLWRGLGESSSSGTGAEDWNVLIDVIEKANEYEVKASIPGVTPEEIDLSLEDNLLTIKAERKAEEIGQDSSYLVRERPVGVFYRTLRLPDSIDSNKIESQYDNGVLTINMAKAEEKKKKQIQIKVKETQKAIEGKK